MPDGLVDVVHSLRLELLFQLALAIVLGGIIGLERELSGKPAGLRTNVLGRFERLVARKAIRSRLVVHAAPQTNLVEELESIVQAAGLEIERSQIRREHVDAVVELELRGPRHCHERALVGIVHHAGVRSISTGE